MPIKKREREKGRKKCEMEKLFCSCWREKIKVLIETRCVVWPNGNLTRLFLPYYKWIERTLLHFPWVDDRLYVEACFCWSGTLLLVGTCTTVFTCQFCFCFDKLFCRTISKRPLALATDVCNTSTRLVWTRILSLNPLWWL